MKNKELIQAKEEIIIDAPRVRLLGLTYGRDQDLHKHYMVRWNTKPHTSVWYRIWNVITNPIVYILFGTWRI